MSFESDFITLVNQDAGITALIAGRVYFQALREGTAKPALVCRVFNREEVSLSGADADYHELLIQIDVHATTMASLVSTSDAVIAHLKRYGGTVGSTIIQDIYLQDVTDLYSDTTRQYGRALDFRVVHGAD